MSPDSENQIQCLLKISSIKYCWALCSGLHTRRSFLFELICHYTLTSIAILDWCLQISEIIESTKKIIWLLTSCSFAVLFFNTRLSSISLLLFSSRCIYMWSCFADNLSSLFCFLFTALRLCWLLHLPFLHHVRHQHRNSQIQSKSGSMQVVALWIINFHVPMLYYIYIAAYMFNPTGSYQFITCK